MITGSFDNEEIMGAIKNDVDDEVVKVEFNAIVFKDLKEIAYTVGLFVNRIYILDSDVFETETMEELKSKMKEIADLIYDEYGIKATYGVDYEGRKGYSNINDEKVG